MNLKSQIHRISCFPYRHFECSREIFLALCSFLLLSQKHSPFSAVSHRTIYTIPSFRAQREIFLALCCFLLLSQKVSPFPLSHIERYTSVPERSLGSARDDDTGIALSKHIRCTLREINPFPHTVMRGAARNLPCTLLFLAPFAKGFPFSAVSHTTLYRCARKIPPLRSG